MRRQAPPGDFRSNLHRGGSAKPVRPNKAEIATAVRAAQILELGVAGVDMTGGAPDTFAYSIMLSILGECALALENIQPGNFAFLIFREMGVALINGLVWGGIMGAVTWWLYSDPQLGAVMTLAMMLNLLMAAMMGVIIPMVMVKLGRDPAVGSSVMITAITDTGGFFIFLGLATIFLM